MRNNTQAWFGKQASLWAYALICYLCVKFQCNFDNRSLLTMSGIYFPYSRKTQAYQMVSTSLNEFLQIFAVSSLLIPDDCIVSLRGKRHPYYGPAMASTCILATRLLKALDIEQSCASKEDKSARRWKKSIRHDIVKDLDDGRVSVYT